MSSTHLNRRQVLRGAGGFSLGLPFLPSLLPRTAGAAVAGSRPRFVAFFNNHGGVRNVSRFPNPLPQTTTVPLYTGHDIRWAPLTATTNAGTTSISTVLSASSSKLTTNVLKKMNLVRGLDHGTYLGHHGGGHLGNIAANSNGLQGMEPYITIDPSGGRQA